MSYSLLKATSNMLFKSPFLVDHIAEMIFALLLILVLLHEIFLV
jgi:hypothetical protein